MTDDSRRGDDASAPDDAPQVGDEPRADDVSQHDGANGATQDGGGAGSSDDLVLALRSQDPARDVEPASDFVARALHRRFDADTQIDAQLLAPPGGGRAEMPAAGVADASSSASAEHPGDAEPAIAHPAEAEPADFDAARRRRRWIAPLGLAAAAVVVLGVGGVVVGSLFVSETDSADETAESLEQSDAAADQQVESEEGSAPGMAEGPIDLGGGGPAAGAASDAAESISASEDAAYSTVPGYGWGRQEFVGSGFSQTSGTAAVYALDPQAATTPQRLQQLGQALGIDGELTKVDDDYRSAWEYRADDTVSLDVEVDGATTFSYYDWRKDPTRGCEAQYDAAMEASVDESDFEDLMAEYEACVIDQNPDVPTEQEAIDQTRDLVSAMGLDPVDFEFMTPDESVEYYFWGYYDTGGQQIQRAVSARRLVDGGPVAVSLDAVWVQDGLSSVTGSLAGPVSLGEYSVISEAEALDRLNDPRFGVAGITGWEDYEYPEYEDYEPRREPPTLPSAGAEVPWPVSTVEVTSVRSGLALVGGWDDVQFLVPAYEFTATDGLTYSVIALAEESLDFSSE